MDEPLEVTYDLYRGQRNEHDEIQDNKDASVYEESWN